MQNFFEQVQQLERLSVAENSRSDKNLALIGTQGLPDRESIRFKSNHRLVFPTADAVQNRELKEGEQQVLLVNFLQLIGPEGVLPAHYSRMVAERIKVKDYASIDFFDMFLHRIISLYYRSWAKYRFVPQFESAGGNGGADRITQVLDSLTGNKNAESELVRYYAGIFSSGVGSSEGLAVMLEDFLQSEVVVREYQADWQALPEECLTRISSEPSKKQLLKHGIFIGRRNRCVQSRITIKVKVKDLAHYNSIKEGTQRYEQAKMLIKKYLPETVTAHLECEISVDKISTRLNGEVRLSRNVWLSSKSCRSVTAVMSIK